MALVWAPYFVEDRNALKEKKEKNRNKRFRNPGLVENKSLQSPKK